MATPEAPTEALPAEIAAPATPRPKRGSKRDQKPPTALVRQEHRQAISPRKRQILQRILAMKVAGGTYEEISQVLGLTPHTIRQYMHEAGKKGWLRNNDALTPGEELEYAVVHKIVRNVHEALDGAELGEGQQEMTIAGARGLGLFKNHEVSKAEGGPQTNVLAVKIEFAPGETVAASLPEGSAGGTPAFIDGEALVEP